MCNSLAFRFGSFFSPLLPSLAVFKVVILYYVKKHSTLRFCVPPIRAFKATHNYRLLITAVSLASLVLVLIPMGYAIVKFAFLFFFSLFVYLWMCGFLTYFHFHYFKLLGSQPQGHTNRSCKLIAGLTRPNLRSDAAP
jgi:hypothetical protein